MNGANPSQACQTTWREHRVWSKTAGAIKRDISFWQGGALAFAGLGAIIETAAAQLSTSSSGKTLSIIGAVILALIPVIRGAKLAKDSVRNWIRARSASEGLKTEIYFYLTQTPPYDGGDRDDQLATRRDQITNKVKDLAAEAAVQRNDKPLPGPLDVNGYIQERVNQQIDGFYIPRAQENARLLKQARGLEFTLGIAAAASGALGAVKGMEQFGAWVAVVTTLAGAVTAHVAAARYEFLAVSYRATAHRLESLRDQWLDSQQPAAGAKMTPAEFIKQCEDAISMENQGWMADWLEAKETPAKQGA